MGAEGSQSSETEKVEDGDREESGRGGLQREGKVEGAVCGKKRRDGGREPEARRPARVCRGEGGRAQRHIRFDHGFECGLALSVCKLVYEVARHTGCVAVQSEEAVVVAQSPGCPERQGMGHAGVRLQLPRQVRQLCGDV